MKKLILIVSVAAMTFGATPFAQASNPITKLTVSANGANERPNLGSKTGTSAGSFILNTSENTFCYSNVRTRGLNNIIGVHVHLGASGIDGSIFIWIDISKLNKPGLSCVKVDHLVLLDIAKYPSDYYFNVHTKTFPGGAVRGQLKRIS